MRLSLRDARRFKWSLRIGFSFLGLAALAYVGAIAYAFAGAM